MFLLISGTFYPTNPIMLSRSMPSILKYLGRKLVDIRNLFNVFFCFAKKCKESLKMVNSATNNANKLNIPSNNTIGRHYFLIFGLQNTFKKKCRIILTVFDFFDMIIRPAYYSCHKSFYVYRICIQNCLISSNFTYLLL